MSTAVPIRSLRATCIDKLGGYSQNTKEVRDDPQPASLADEIARIRHTLTAVELAVWLGCTASYLLRRAKQGKMPSYRIGGMVRFDPIQIAAWLRKQSMQ